MKLLLLLALMGLNIYAAQVVQVADKYKDSTKCKACHNHIVTQWDNSWHARSHYDNDEYLQKTIDYVARKESGKSLNTIKVECAACHNPRISVTSTTSEYDAIAALKLDKDSAVNKAINSDRISEGINCVVCHNIDQIHDNLPDTKRGINRVDWMPSGTMTGPYGDAKSPYHKVQQRDFMDTNPNQLCFVCHANDTSEEGHRFIDMQSEFKSGGKQCVDCHMSPRKDGVAATIRDASGQAHKRLIRDHGFIGGHIEKMWNGALKVDVSKSSRGLEVTLTNPQPHAIPSGFGAREILIEAQYLSSGKNIKNEVVSLTNHYISRHNKPTVPHLAVKTVESISIPAEGSKSFSIPIASGSDQVIISVSYRLVNDEVRGILDLKDPLWSKKMIIKQVKLKL
ncbi:MAG: multiheme c-type cytochrome [Sulfuricurvum sp.]|nr:multiheme c-type cytochrome [Sulfuricurvum sp.]